MRLVSAPEMTSDSVAAVVSWYEAEGAGGWPSRESFRPEDLPARILPQIGLVDVETDPLRVFYRVLGEDICASIGRTIRMAYLDGLGLPQEAELLALYGRALDSPGPLFVKGKQRIEGDDLNYEGACFPLGAPPDPVRRFVIVEDFLDTQTWRETLRRRHYRLDGE